MKEMSVSADDSSSEVSSQLEVKSSINPININLQPDSISLAIKKSLSSATLFCSGRLFIVMGGIANNAFRSRFSLEALAASGLIETTRNSLGLLSETPPLAGSLVMKEVLVNNESKRVGIIFRQIILMGLMTQCYSIPFYAAMEPLLNALGQPQNVTTLVGDYYKGFIATTALIPNGIAQYCVFVALNRVAPPPAIYFLFFATVTASAYPLIYRAGSEGLSTLGSGLVDLIGEITVEIAGTSLVLLSRFYRPYELYNIREMAHNFFDKFKRWQKRLWQEGGPVLVAVSTELVTMFAFGIYAGLLGEDALAAINIGLQVNIISDVINAGLFSSTSNLVRESFIKRNRRNVKLYGNLGLAIGFSFAAIPSVLSLVIPKQIASIYMDINDPANEELVNITVSSLRWIAPMTMMESLKKNSMFALYWY